jgi:DNA Polymerase alpha zinc finger.
MSHQGGDREWSTRCVVNLASVQSSLLMFKTNIEAVAAVITANSEFLRTMSDCVNQYLDQCGRRWVELSRLFSFIKI